MAIVTVTLNPAIDQTIMIDRLVPGEVHRARQVQQHPGGKGVNVASCLADWGCPVAAAGLLGADNAVPFETLFRDKAIADRFVRFPGATRVNLKIVDDRRTTDINFDGPAVPADRIELAMADIVTQASEGDMMILSGSLPAGCGIDQYRSLLERLAPSGARILLDTSGEPLAAALAGGAMPWCIKPNRRELADWAGQPLPRLADVVDVAAALNRRGIALVVVSMGAEGALFLSAEGALLARLPVDALASTVGAGDAMVAGIAAAAREGAGLERIARLATAFAVAKLGRPGPNLPALPTIDALVEDVTITAVDMPQEMMRGEA
ncbi:1-phosphofructokinase [Flavisphingomonas formosensis]|uniref:1-phosphofructokinase n=1 Tax=Flavisphingomonas formosensis TaxID=861534 RepID=UPI0012FCD81B|nr:1-phosphofructokinase [Sphingomonas formosensis]